MEAVEEGGRRASVEHADADGAAEVRRRTQHVRRVVAVVRLGVVGQVSDAVVPQRQPRPAFGNRHDQLATSATEPGVQQPDRYTGVNVDPATGGTARTTRADEQVSQARADVDLRLVTAVEHLDAQPVGPTDAALRLIDHVHFRRAFDVV